jgi:DNA mismatch repair protein MutL
VVDRIAAGEVIERPASVVKELVENALDAGASRLDVTIEQGGLGRIRVADDGAGISEEDLPLAVAPHATSKLTDVDDLFHIASFGFRGEALSSVAAVSRLTITSRPAGEPAGHQLQAHGGRVGSPQPAACAPGTIVDVRDLFFNTPARRRFLGTARTEAARCREVCAALSLVHPGVRWRLTSDGQARFTAEGSERLEQRAQAIYGTELLEQMVGVRGRSEGLAVEGLLSLPSAARARPRVQLLFVNQRLVRERAVTAAVRSACLDFLPGGLQPSWILCLTLDPERIDVNVHPTKAELRFRESDALFRLLRSAARQALLSADLAPHVRVEHLPSGPPAPSGPGAVAGGGLLQPLRRAVSSSHEVGPADRSAPGVAPLDRVSEPGALRPAARYLQVLDTYLVHDGPDGLVLVDQHALHERILYARLQRDLAEGRLPSQRLLVPETVRLAPSLHERALAARDELASLGLELDAFGPDTLAVQAVPAVLRGESVPELVETLLDPPELHGGIPHDLDRRLFTMACHAAVKAGDRLDEAEIESLLRQGQELEHDATCPHGRPTRLLIGRAELERLFKRSGF